MTRCWYASRRFVYLFAFILSAKVLIFACRVTLLSHRIREVQNLLYHLSMGLKICSLVTQSYKPFGKGQMFFLFFSYVYARGVKFYRAAIGINIVNFQIFLIIYTKNFNFSLYLCITTTSLSTLCQTKTCSFMTWDWVSPRRAEVWQSHMMAKRYKAGIGWEVVKT